MKKVSRKREAMLSHNSRNLSGRRGGLLLVNHCINIAVVREEKYFAPSFIDFRNEIFKITITIYLFYVIHIVLQNQITGLPLRGSYNEIRCPDPYCCHSLRRRGYPIQNRR